MKNKLFIVFLCVLLSLPAIITVSASAQNDYNTLDEAKGFIDGIVSCLQTSADMDSVQEWIDGTLTQTAGISAEWYILALTQSGEYDFSSYERSLLGYLEKNEVYSASSRLKYALCLASVGSTDRYISSALNASVGKQGIMSWVYALHLMNNGYACGEYTASQAIDELLSLQSADGGWALSGESGDVDVSSMTVQALSASYTSDIEVKEAVDLALAFLSEHQLEDGGYANYGAKNPESAAQVLVALCSLGIDCKTDERFIKNGKTLFDAIAEYRLPDGSFCHAEGGQFNSNATAQVLYSMVAYVRMADGKTPLYILDRGNPSEAETIPFVSVNETESPARPSDDIKDGEGKPLGHYKIWVSLSLIGIGGISCLILFLAKRRHIKNFIAVFAAVLLAVLVVCFTDIQSSENYYGGEGETKANAIGKVSITIRCDEVLGKIDSEYIPSDGIILATTEFDIEQGETVYDILIEAARKHRIQIENRGISEMAYIAGIHYLYELDFGEFSGWTYRVNGKIPSVGCGEYELSDGDVIEWHYTCSLGKDIE